MEWTPAGRLCLYLCVRGPAPLTASVKRSPMKTKTLAMIGVAVMVITILAEVLGPGYSAGRHLEHAGWFLFGLGGFLYARRSRLAWPIMLVCPVLLFASEVAGCLAGEQSFAGCWFACSLSLLMALGLCIGWAHERRHGHGA